MKTLFLLAVAAVLASADDLDDRLLAAAKQIASDDPAAQEAGERALLKAAPDGGPRLRTMLDALDEADRPAVRTVVLENGLFFEEKKTRRCRSLFRKITKMSTLDSARRVLIKELLELGEPAAAQLAAELRHCDALAVRFRTRVVDPDSINGVSLVLRNAGKRALWFNSAGINQGSRLYGFGTRTGKFPWFSGRSIGDVFGEEPGTPEDRLLDDLDDMVRLPAGKRFELDPAPVRTNDCGMFYVRSWHTEIDRRKSVATFSGVRIPFPVAKPKASPMIRLALVRETTSKAFRATIVPEGASFVLEVTALEDRAAPPEKPDFDRGFDHVWWLAEGADRLFLGCGAIRREPEREADWKKDEVRRYALPVPLPDGTKRLWMGFDEVFPKEQVIAAPVEIRR